MHLVIRKRRLPGPRVHNPRAVQESDYQPGTLPVFSKSLGLDFIITPQGRAVLVELQHGFGRRGMLELWPASARLYRKTYWACRREYGKCWEITDGVRRICSDKVQTYKHFSRFQPSSFVYRGWNTNLERWLDGLSSDFILAKPPRGSCGKGILVLDRKEFRRSAGTTALGLSRLLQEYVESRLLRDPGGQEHVGCIRHIMILVSDGQRLHFNHLPSYWRVSPSPYIHQADYEALTANISRGAFPLPVSHGDCVLVRDMAEQVTGRLVRRILDLPHVEHGSSKVLYDG